MIFEVKKLTLKVEFWHFLTPPHYTNPQNSMIFFGYVDFYAKILLIVQLPLENLTTCITILPKQSNLNQFSKWDNMH